MQTAAGLAAVRQHESELRALKMADAEYEAAIRLMESQLRAAEVAANAATESYELAKTQHESGRLTTTELRTKGVAMEQAKARLQQAHTIYELYRKARDVANSGRSEPTSESSDRSK